MKGYGDTQIGSGRFIDENHLSNRVSDKEPLGYHQKKVNLKSRTYVSLDFTKTFQSLIKL